MTAEKEKQYSLEKIQTTKEPSKIKIKNIIIGSFIVVIIISAVYYGFIFVSKLLNPPEIVITELKIPTFIFPNYQRELFLKNLKKQTFVDSVLEEEKTISIPLGSIMQLYPTKEDSTKQFVVEGTEGNKTLIITPSLFNILEAKNPTSLTRALDPDFILGYHSSLGNKPFLLFTVNSYENAFAGMLNWEKTMYQDFSPIFVREDTKLEKQTIYEFKDVVIVNKDVRVILNNEGKIEFAYSFLNKNTLLITNNESTLEEIFRRINTAGLERIN
jgi:flagellar basal body-associated protein FliL